MSGFCQECKSSEIFAEPRTADSISRCTHNFTTTDVKKTFYDWAEFVELFAVNEQPTPDEFTQMIDGDDERKTYNYISEIVDDFVKVTKSYSYIDICSEDKFFVDFMREEPDDEIIDVEGSDSEVESHVDAKLLTDRDSILKDLEKLVRKGRSFSIVSCGNFLNTLPEGDQAKVISLAYQLLDEGGMFFFQDFHCASWKDAYFFRYRHNIIKKHIESGGISDRLTLRTRESWKALFEKENFVYPILLLPAKKNPYNKFVYVFFKP